MGNDRVESLLVVRSLCTNEKLLYNNCTVQIVSFFFRVLTTPHNAHIKTMGSEHCTVISFLHHVLRLFHCFRRFIAVEVGNRIVL